MKPIRYPAQVNVAMSDELKARLDHASKSQNVSMSEFSRDAIEKEVVRCEKGAKHVD